MAAEVHYRRHGSDETFRGAASPLEVAERTNRAVQVAKALKAARDWAATQPPEDLYPRGTLLGQAHEAMAAALKKSKRTHLTPAEALKILTPGSDRAAAIQRVLDLFSDGAKWLTKGPQ